MTPLKPSECGYLYHDPWNGGWRSYEEYVASINGRTALSRTCRYRLGRRWELLRRRPHRADTHALVCKLASVSHIEHGHGGGPLNYNRSEDR